MQGSLVKGERLMTYRLYHLVSSSTDSYYIGMTKSKLNTRLIQHSSSCRLGKKTKLYDCMRKYGNASFSIVEVGVYDTREACCLAEKEAIKTAVSTNHKLLNLAPGGEGGFVIQDIDSWKRKLRIARKGRRPALGMKHSMKNKQLFSGVSKEYWSSQTTYDKDVICQLPFKEAAIKYGISKTHYYRLRRSSPNE